MVRRILRPLGQVGEKEGATAFLMFTYSFLAMTAYNIVKPVTRSQFISDWGGDNLPYVPLATGILIGGVMAGYAWLMSRLPRRWALQITQGIIAGLLVTFVFLFQTKQQWVSVAFYFLGLILGILLISQFWTLANVVYDARQAKRLFGLIGGGAPLGGIVGSLTSIDKRVGTAQLLLISAAFMVVCLTIVTIIVFREKVGGPAPTKEKKGVGAKRALELLRGSKHLQMIALVISFGAIGAFIIEQQLLLAAEAEYGQHAADAIRSFYAKVQLATSIGGLVIQVALTSRIQRFLGIGFALMILPTNLGATALIMLFNAVLWAPGLARVLDQSLRYTVDKTTREILYMPLPFEIKFEAKPFVDVTVDRFAKAFGAILMLVLIQPWGLDLSWQQVSYASVLVTCLWFFLAVRAKRGYQNAFRQSIETREMKPAEVRLAEADLSTVETLIQELGSPDENRVLYAIDLLETLGKRNLVTPLLLYHESPAVRVRALSIISSTHPEISARWMPAIQRMIGDESADVRMAAISALAKIRSEQAAEMVRSFLGDNDPRIATTAALLLLQCGSEQDASAAEQMLRNLATDARESTARARKDLASAIGRISGAGFRRLLIPLLHDPNPEVAEEAMRNARQVAARDFFFVPTFISLLRNRRLKSSAREMLVSYGEDALPILEHFLRDPEEEIWVRRHIPATIARIPCQQAMDILVGALEEQDRFLRYKVVAGIERLRRTKPELTYRHEPLETLVLDEAFRHAHYRPLYRRLFEENGHLQSSLLARALTEKMERVVDRTYRLLGVLYPWKDIAAARRAIERGDQRSRASALEYLDNLLKGPLRKQVVPILEQKPPAAVEREQKETEVTKFAQESLLELIYDPDEVIAATAIYLVWQLKLENLAGHIEQVLATRDVRDWYVFEAASWVLAAFRMPDRQRRALWHEPLPAVELAEQLHSLPLFASVSVDELFRIARAGQQVRHEPGKVLYEMGSPPGSLQVLLEGEVAFGTRTGEGRESGPPAALGLQEVLEGKPMAETIRAVDAAVCLAASNEEFMTVLADNTSLVQGLFRQLRAGAPEETGRLLLKGNASGKALTMADGSLKPIEKVLTLGAIPLFSSITADELLWLASITEETPLAADSTLFREGDPPALYVLTAGRVALESSQDIPPVSAGPSDAVGVYETLAGLALTRQARVVERGSALRIHSDELFDLLAQRSELLQQFFRALFRYQ
jgi:AAA family ATP:ADP antiporter